MFKFLMREEYLGYGMKAATMISPKIPNVFRW
jgi:hypothetical protein